MNVNYFLQKNALTVHYFNSFYLPPDSNQKQNIDTFESLSIYLNTKLKSELLLKPQKQIVLLAVEYLFKIYDKNKNPESFFFIAKFF